MKKIIKLLLITVLVFSSLKANAVILNDAEIKSAIEKQVKNNYKKYTDAEVQVKVVALPFSDLSLPDGKINFVVKPSMDKFMARDLEKVSVYVDGRFIKKFNAPVVVRVYQDILVASCYISRERELDNNLTRVERREISNHFNYVLKPKALQNHIMTKKVFAEGEEIDKRFVKLRPNILRNATVNVTFSTNDLEITVEGIALSDGIIGENICIMNKDYNKIYKGTVIGENQVMVKI